MVSVFRFTFGAVLFSALLGLQTAAAVAGTCEAQVVGVKPIAAYNHDAGSGFLAVRAGPGSGYNQIGELYLGDWMVVMGRQGKWYYIGCYEGRCMTPLWGQPSPEGWAYGGYLNVGGVCDF